MSDRATSSFKEQIIALQGLLFDVTKARDRLAVVLGKRNENDAYKLFEPVQTYINALIRRMEKQ